MAEDFNERKLTCDDFDDLGLLPHDRNFSCCDSCHEDDEAGYDSLVEFPWRLNTIAHVCCNAARVLEEDDAGDTIPDEDLAQRIRDLK